jgi:hypothetical protein
MERHELFQKIREASLVASMFMTPSDGMAVDNFLRLVEEKRAELVAANNGQLTNALDDKAVADSILEDPQGWASSEKFRGLVDCGMGLL